MSHDDELGTLARDVVEATLRWAFHSSDDIPRLPHPVGWMPDFAPAALERRRVEIAELRARWRAVDASAATPSAQIEHRLAGAILNRAHWDLNVTRNAERNAVFQFSQILGPFYDLTLPLPPYDDARQDALIAVLAAVPAQVEVARAHLEEHGVADLARAAVTEMESIGTRVRTGAEALRIHVDPARHAALGAAAEAAAAALDEWCAWLDDAADRMAPARAVGRDSFVWFLRAVALIPDDPDDLVRAATQDLNRAIVWEQLTRNRYRNAPPAELARTIEEQVDTEARHERQIRDFYEREDLLSQPETLKHYLIAEMPPWIEQLRSLGVPDDLTDEQRLAQNAVSYMPKPRTELPYFYAANAKDPRLGIIHEGAHYQQLALSWASASPIRRRYIDSSANEGVAHYNEEMMLMAGLFDDAPHSETVVHNFARLRALRVIADVNLATGEFTLAQAIEHFVNAVPMDAETAREESAMYLATPGLAMSYHVGKQQMLALVADAIAAWGEEFSFRRIHDAVWQHGNTPFSLLRWEILGDRSAIDRLDADLAELSDPVG